MRWVRTKVRFGASWALFALAAQYTLSFGHVHRIDIAGLFVASLQFTLTDHASSAAMPDAPAVPINPPGPFGYCEICAVASLVGNAVPVTAPQLSLPPVIHQMRFWLQVDDASAIAAHRLFQARAPPRA